MGALFVLSDGAVLVLSDADRCVVLSDADRCVVGSDTERCVVGPV